MIKGNYLQTNRNLKLKQYKIFHIDKESTMKSNASYHHRRINKKHGGIRAYF